MPIDPSFREELVPLRTIGRQIEIRQPIRASGPPWSWRARGYQRSGPDWRRAAPRTHPRPVAGRRRRSCSAAGDTSARPFEEEDESRFAGLLHARARGASRTLGRAFPDCLVRRRSGRVVLVRAASWRCPLDRGLSGRGVLALRRAEAQTLGKPRPMSACFRSPVRSHRPGRRGCDTTRGEAAVLAPAREVLPGR
jgi:hypothetical protein